ncbi:hypothetical protein JW851_01515 [Candidatus Woesearchaeota archaeon]|nr:hypothetical protein [Candidatus Woesearchaeota archaeon]
MMFQVLILDEIRNLFYYLQMAGILDILIPFVLIFTVLFAVMKNVQILKDLKQQVVVALAITLLVLVPHITGSIPAEYDVVQIINNSLPSVVLVIFIILMAMILLGFIVNKPVKLGDLATGIVALISLVLIGVIFARSAGYFQTGWPNWLYFLDDPQLGALVIVILMFALITWFITAKKKDVGDRIRDKVKDYLEKFGKQLFRD